MIDSILFPFLQFQQSLLEQNHDFFAYVFFWLLSSALEFTGYTLIHCTFAYIIRLSRKVFSPIALLKIYSFSVKSMVILIGVLTTYFLLTYCVGHYLFLHKFVTRPDGVSFLWGFLVVFMYIVILYKYNKLILTHIYSPIAPPNTADKEYFINHLYQNPKLNAPERAYLMQFYGIDEADYPRLIALQEKHQSETD